MILYLRAHATLYRECRYDRWVHAISMIVLPVAAFRGLDKLSRDALTRYSPVVVLPLLCGRATSTTLVRTLLIDLRRSGPPTETTAAAVTVCLT